MWHAEKLRVQIQNASVCTFETPPRVYITCGPVAGTHGYVLNVHTEGVESTHGGVRSRGGVNGEWGGRGEREGGGKGGGGRRRTKKRFSHAPEVRRQ